MRKNILFLLFMYSLNAWGQRFDIVRAVYQNEEVPSKGVLQRKHRHQKRVIFSPNKSLSGSLRRVTHIMTYTIVQPFSNQKTEVIYHLTKQRSRRKP